MLYVLEDSRGVVSTGVPATEGFVEVPTANPRLVGSIAGTKFSAVGTGRSVRSKANDDGGGAETVVRLTAIVEPSSRSMTNGLAPCGPSRWHPGGTRGNCGMRVGTSFRLAAPSAATAARQT